MIEYTIIKQIYKNNTAKRTGVPYINHIDEGICVLDAINSSEIAKKAFCLHPLLQVNTFGKEFLQNTLVASTDKIAVITASMYANTANAYLCKTYTDTFSLKDIEKVTGITERTDISDMLVADKVQNYKDFLIYHKDTHPRRKELDKYFRAWLDFLSQFYNYKNGTEMFNILVKFCEICHGN